MRLVVAFEIGGGGVGVNHGHVSRTFIKTLQCSFVLGIGGRANDGRVSRTSIKTLLLFRTSRSLSALEVA